jgi:hypothetical protein
MNFQEPYLLAMQDQAPKMARYLTKTGAMDKHLKDKTKEAYEMLAMLTAEDDGLTNYRRAENLILETLIEFPDETTPD